MLVSIDWIKDFVKIPEISSEELGIKFTLSTAEVEEVIEDGAFLEKIRIAQITDIEKHPEADKLNLVSFKLSDSESYRVVCGAKNCRVGMRVAYAPLGTTLPIGFTLEPKKIRGILSEGMLCSEEELGFSESSDGILDLPENAVLGDTYLKYLERTKDTILDIDNKSLTHRPDLWGHFGLAREFGAIFGEDLNDRFDDLWEKKIESYFTKEKSPIIPTVDSDSSSLGYYGLSMDGITISESPDYIKRRLNAVGLRPINNIVDISNYVMLELGIPLHIFDRNLIEDNTIHIQRIKEEQTFTTLDEVERKLVVGDTVISDSKKPLVLAGIMGGLNSGVSDNTSQIFIEVANWKAAEIRTTSTRLGLRTDSSTRYEKSLDSILLKRTLYRTIELVKELCPDSTIVGTANLSGVDLDSIETKVVTTHYSKMNSVLGVSLEDRKINEIFSALGFVLKQNGDEVEVTIPSYRATKDIECEEDLMEEIGRIIGFDNIPESSPRLSVKPKSLLPHQKLHRNIRNFMSLNAKAHEIMTYPLIGDKTLQKAKLQSFEPLRLVNALSKETEIMRPTLIASLLESVALNQKNFDTFRMFEIGRVYNPDNKNFSKEANHLGVVYFSKDETPFLDVLNCMDELKNFIKIPADFCDAHSKFKNNLIDESWLGVHPYEFQNIRVMGKMNGVVLSIHPLVLRSYKIKGNVSIALLDLSIFENQELKSKFKYNPLAKYPGSTFDWTVVLKNDQTVGGIFEQLKKIKIKELSSVKIAATFKPDSEQSFITLRASFIDPEKTLEGEFLNQAKKRLVEGLEGAGYPLKV